jgi:excisionase family DNA binding protein
MTPGKSKMAPITYDDLPELLTVAEAQRFLRISRGLIYDLVRRGELPSVRFGRLLRIPKTALRSTS